MYPAGANLQKKFEYTVVGIKNVYDLNSNRLSGVFHTNGVMAVWKLEF